MLIACLALVLSAGSVCAAEQRYDINIPALRADASLKALARQTSAQLLFPYDLVRTIQANPVSGRYTLNEALEILLQSTGLSSSTTKGGVITITASRTTAQQDGDEDMTGRRKLSILGAIAALFGVGNHSAWADQTLTEDSKLTEIVVTAEKREERLMDVPVAVTALDAQTLANNNLNRLQDYFDQVPGLALTGGTFGSGTQSLAIRGITTAWNTNPTVAVVIDDIPFGPTSENAFGGFLIPDIDPGDLARVEVLKGPQGTLYGASSLGGLVKFVTQDPSTDGFSGRLQAQGDYIEHGTGGYGGRGSVNIALSDTLAIRASGFTRRDPGYVDNVTTGQKNVNQVDTSGGRLSLLWKPSESFSVKLGAMLQKSVADGSPAINTNEYLNTNNYLVPTLGDFQLSGMRGINSSDSQLSLYSANIAANFGEVKLTSVTGFGESKWYESNDISAFFASTANANFPPADGSAQVNNYDTKKFTQELRLTSSIGKRFDWLLGVFYTHEVTSPSYESDTANDVQSGRFYGVLYQPDNPTNILSERAVFADVTTHFTDHFDVQIGGRESWNSQEFAQTTSGAIVPTPIVVPTGDVSGSAFTYLITPEYRFNADLMAYVRVASGYRVGGFNVNAAPGGPIPVSYNPDKTTDYELGFKAYFLNHIIQVDASAYYIDWKNIQLAEFADNTGFQSNGGTAKSQGLEFSVLARPLQGLSLSAVASFTDAVLTENLPAAAVANGTYGLSGYRLPYSSRFSGSLSADQDIAHVGSATGFVGATLSYVGLRYGDFFGEGQARPEYPGYATLNLRAGVRFESWLVNLFVNNATDKWAISGLAQAYNFQSSGYMATVIQPRTVGLSLTREF